MVHAYGGTRAPLWRAPLWRGLLPYNIHHRNYDYHVLERLEATTEYWPSYCIRDRMTDCAPRNDDGDGTGEVNAM